MIYTEDKIVKLKGVALPGLVKSIEVSQSAKVEEQEVEGSESLPKQATGYEDAKVHIELLLDDTRRRTKYQRLRTLRRLFKKPGQTIPEPMPIVCAETRAHGIKNVIFKDISHKRENKHGQLPVVIELWEYGPPVISVSGGSGTEVEPNSEIMSAVSNVSPSYDSANPAAALEWIAQQPF